MSDASHALIKWVNTNRVQARGDVAETVLPGEILARLTNLTHAGPNAAMLMVTAPAAQICRAACTVTSESDTRVLIHSVWCQQIVNRFATRVDNVSIAKPITTLSLLDNLRNSGYAVFETFRIFWDMTFAGGSVHIWAPVEDTFCSSIGFCFQDEGPISAQATNIIKKYKKESVMAYMCGQHIYGNYTFSDQDNK